MVNPITLLNDKPALRKLIFSKVLSDEIILELLEKCNKNTIFTNYVIEILHDAYPDKNLIELVIAKSINVKKTLNNMLTNYPFDKRYYIKEHSENIMNVLSEIGDDNLCRSILKLLINHGLYYQPYMKKFLLKIIDSNYLKTLRFISEIKIIEMSQIFTTDDLYNVLVSGFKRYHPKTVHILIKKYVSRLDHLPEYEKYMAIKCMCVVADIEPTKYFKLMYDMRDNFYLTGLSRPPINTIWKVKNRENKLLLLDWLYADRDPTPHGIGLDGDPDYSIVEDVVKTLSNQTN